MVGQRRKSLSNADLSGFVLRASTEYAGLADYTWQQADQQEKAVVVVRPGLSIPFKAIVPDEDGVFFFGWDAPAATAVWKWVPLVVPGRDSEGWRIIP